MDRQTNPLSAVKVFVLGAFGAIVSLFAAIAIRLGVEAVPAYAANFTTQILVTSFIYATTLFAFGVDYASSRRDHSLWAVTHLVANVVAWVVSLAFVYLQGLDRIGRGIFILFGVLDLLIFSGWHLVRTRLSDRWLPQRRVLVVGCGASAEMISGLLRASGKWRLYPVALLHLGEGKTEIDLADFPVYTGSATVYETARMVRADCIVLASSAGELDDDLLVQLYRFRLDGLEVLDSGELYETFTGRISLRMIDDYWNLFLRLTRVRPINPTLKRMMDIVLTIGSLVLAGSVMAAIAVALKISSPGPVFYRQERLGQDGRPFRVIKFRTMIPDAEATTGAVWAREDDPRITGIGRFLRRWRLDELPQLVNVLRGEMSLVGPRPERDVFVSDFLQKVPVFKQGRRKDDVEGTHVFDGWREAVNLYPMRLMVKPGVTGWAQVKYPYAASFEETQAKFEYDLYYIKHQSLLFDLAILIRTVGMLFVPKGR